MADTTQHSSQTRQLLRLLADCGFQANPDRAGRIAAQTDGLVENPGRGIWIHADAEMIRLVVDEPGLDEPGLGPGYRLVLGRHGLGAKQSLQIIAVHARTAVAERISMRMHVFRPL